MLAQFTTAKIWKQPTCPSTDEGIKKVWYVYTHTHTHTHAHTHTQWNTVLCWVTQSCPTSCNPMDCSPHLSMRILQAWRLAWVAMPSSRESSQPRDQTQVSHTAGRFFTSWTTREAPNGILLSMKKTEIMPCAATWTRDYYTKWKKSERERQMPYDIT